jgi:nucleoside phosphorylase
MKQTQQKVAKANRRVSSQPGNTGASRVDFVLVTALPEERDAVLCRLPGHKKLPPTDDDLGVYYSAELKIKFPDGARGSYSVVVVPLLGMGRVKASNATKEAIFRWKPRYVVLVGIAGGISKNGANLGDLLISDQIVDYELQKLHADRDEPRYEVHRADPRLLGGAQNFTGESWLKLVRTKRPRKGKSEIRFGPIATGDKVDARGNFLAKHYTAFPKMIGIEMEAGGVASASFSSANPPRFFMIRGVSDLADGDKDSPKVVSWRAYACDVAASYAVALLKSGPVPLKMTRAPDSPGRPAAKGSDLIQDNWDLFEPELQDALAIALNESLRNGSATIRTRNLFAAWYRLKPESLRELFELLPTEALPRATKKPDRSKKRILREELALSGCVTDSLQHMTRRATPRRKLSSKDVFVDIAKHGHGASVAQLRNHGVSAKKIDRYVKDLRLDVLKRGRSSLHAL